MMVVGLALIIMLAPAPALAEGETRLSVVTWAPTAGPGALWPEGFSPPYVGPVDCAPSRQGNSEVFYLYGDGYREAAPAPGPKQVKLLNRERKI